MEGGDGIDVAAGATPDDATGGCSIGGEDVVATGADSVGGDAIDTGVGIGVANARRAGVGVGVGLIDSRRSEPGEAAGVVRGNGEAGAVGCGLGGVGTGVGCGAWRPEGCKLKPFAPGNEKTGARVGVGDGAGVGCCADAAGASTVTAAAVRNRPLQEIATLTGTP